MMPFPGAVSNASAKPLPSVSQDAEEVSMTASAVVSVIPSLAFAPLASNGTPVKPASLASGQPSLSESKSKLFKIMFYLGGSGNIKYHHYQCRCRCIPSDCLS